MMLEDIREQQKITEDYVHSVDQYRKENEALQKEVEWLKTIEDYVRSIDQYCKENEALRKEMWRLREDVIRLCTCHYDEEGNVVSSEDVFP